MGAHADDRSRAAVFERPLVTVGRLAQGVPANDGVGAVLLALGRAGIELAPHPSACDRVRHRPALLPPSVSALLRLHRAEVVRLLVAGYAPDDGTDGAVVLAERLSIADDLGMPTHPGASAWLIAVGESILAGGLTS